MPDIAKQINELTAIISGLSLFAKSILSVIVASVALLILSIIWLGKSKTDYAEEKGNISSGKEAIEDKTGANQTARNTDRVPYSGLEEAITDGDIPAIKRIISDKKATPPSLSYQYGSNVSVLQDLNVGDQIFDIVIVPDDRPYMNAPQIIELTKLLSPNRSLFASENEKLMQSLRDLSERSDLKKTVAQAIIAREDYRKRIPGFFLINLTVVSGKREIMTKLELERNQGMNNSSYKIRFITYNTFLEYIKRR